jgi:hypothetical protein
MDSNRKESREYLGLKLCSICIKNIKCFTTVYIHSAVTKISLQRKLTKAN